MALRSTEVCRLIVLGSTGSIGTQMLEVAGHLNGLHARGEWPVRYDVLGLGAGNNKGLLKQQAERFGVRHLAAGGDEPGSCAQLVREIECDLVVAAISGAAGLPATLAAVELGRDVALANKETLVAAGSLVVAAARKSGAKLLPVDSEHSGAWQCLDANGQIAPPMVVGAEVRRVVLTASGGPFRTWTREQMEKATPEQALKHPTWSMGKKVTIDSATLMNKALEVVEAHCLFGLPAEKIEVVVHPQSLVHAMVEFADGSVVSQMGAADMRTPIQHALTWPQRAPGMSRKLDSIGRLDFEPVDHRRFPAVGLAYRAIHEGSGAVMNAANEAAVEAFLAGRIGFTKIVELVERAMDGVRGRSAALAEVIETGIRAREFVNARIG